MNGNTNIYKVVQSPGSSPAFSLCPGLKVREMDNATQEEFKSGADLGGGCRGCAPPPPPEMTCGFLIQLVFCKKKICGLLVLK